MEASPIKLTGWASGFKGCDASVNRCAEHPGFRSGSLSGDASVLRWHRRVVQTTEGSDPMADTPRSLDELLAHCAIERVLNKYCNSLTAQDFDGVASCFSPDADFAGMRGRHGIKQAFSRHFNVESEPTGLPIDMLTRGQYFLSNLEIDLHGDVATAFSFGHSHLLGPRGGQSVLLVRGFTYTDELVHQEEGWLIRSRTHQFKWMYETTPLAESGEALPINEL